MTLRLVPDAEHSSTLGRMIGEAMHEASQVGGPWTPCTVPFNQWPECEHEPMGQHVAVILEERMRSLAGLDK